mmetsp:Transcript_13167/g.21372  ORF Transcript_13167/g.21372 Transcript_13167/m.21372 type:complete len:568 (+) Transcript_13167:114-1817(+)|eukprot:CAMPEP_0203753616 /NCGR_PEP_ID=MMETSP0098-20131031/7354_1 /ASSEMBLY_ACC=CAM_ASM_000208 /TAXON_ID=96639 /ORGANISM=" , Strain NY0313808BC1" /LENGTH=567 /DNA_ID=CAMNT_0050644285 /DNA_START=121 /DNA_END=1824 /DNA_ORIENTATION=-
MLGVIGAGTRYFRQAVRPIAGLRGFATNVVNWSDDFVASSNFPEIDSGIAENERFTEFMIKGFLKRGSDLAIYDGTTEERRSFETVHGNVYSLAAGFLTEYGIGFKSTVALLTPNHVDFFACMHGVAKLGGIVTPINPLYTAPEIAKQLKNSDTKLIIAHPDCLEVAKLAADEKNATLEHGQVFCEVACIDNEIQEFRKMVPDYSLPDTPAGPHDTVLLPYSSGTTGMPKGVELTHSNLIYNVLQSEAIETRFMDQHDSVISPLPLFHIYAYLVSLHNTLRIGCPLITMKRFDLDLFCDLTERYSCTRAHVVPPILLQLAKNPIVDKYDLSSLKVAVSAAAPLGADLEKAVEERIGCKVKQLWGMSELSPLGTGNADDGIKPYAGSVGPPVAGTSAKITCLTTGKNVAPNVEGELCIKGPQVMKGYLNAPEKTSECLSEDGWLKTGDIGKLDEDGYVYITDRLKELIKYKGYQVAPAELESVLYTHPSVMDTCVIPRACEEAGEIPRAYVSLKPEYKDSTSEADIIKYVDEKVAPHKRLRGGVVFTENIPKTESGKILRRKVVQMDK